MALPKLKRKDSTPRSLVTGTSYQATGSQTPEAANYSEMGSSIPTVLIDPVPELANRSQAARTYKKMVRTDSSVKVSLRAGKAPVLGADFFIEAFDEQEINLIIAEFVEYNLFHGMTTPWLRTVNQALKMYENGSSVFEDVWELREWSPQKAVAGANRRQYTMLKKLAVRPSESIKNYEYDDNGGPTGVVQTAVNSKGQTKEVTIPIDKLVVFPFDENGGNLEGESILRSAYENWYYKYYLYKIDAIQKERHGIGVPDIALQPGYSQTDLKWAHELGSNLRTNERAHIVRTTMMEVGFAELSGHPVNVLGSIEHHDNQIMKNIMVQFLNMGTVSSGGGRATGATAMDMFLKSMEFIAQGIICDSINLYLIPKLIAYNFKTDQFPKLRVKNVGQAKDLQMWSAAMANLVDKGLITMDDETEQWVRKNVDAPKKLGSRPADVKPAPKVPSTNGNAPTNGNTPSGADGSGGGGTGATKGNIGKSPSSGAV
jgi:hypothetical protein